MSVYFCLFEVMLSNIVYPVNFKMKQFFLFSHHIYPEFIMNLILYQIVCQKILLKLQNITDLHRFLQILLHTTPFPNKWCNIRRPIYTLVYSHITLNLPSCSCSTFSSIMLARMFPCRNKLQSKSVIFPMVVTSSYLSLALIMLEHSMKEKVSWWLAKSATDTTR